MELSKLLIIFLTITPMFHIKTSEFLPDELQIKILKYTKKHGDFLENSLISSCFYHLMWEFKKRILLKKLVRSDINHQTEHYQKEQIKEQLTKHSIPLNIQDWIFSNYDKKRLKLIFTLLPPWHHLFKDHLKQNIFLKEKREFSTKQTTITYELYHYCNDMLVRTSGLNKFFMQERKKYILPLLQHFKENHAIKKVFLRFLNFPDILPFITKDNLHLFSNLIDIKGNHLFFGLVEHDQTDILQLYREKNYDLNQTNAYGESLLHCAKTPKMVSFFLSLPSVKKETVSSSGHPPLHKLCFYSKEFKSKKLEVFTHFVKSNTSISTRNNYKRTILHLAALLNEYQLAKRVLEEKININCQDIFGDTALHIACQHGHKKIITLLIEHGADKTIKNNLGKKPEIGENSFYKKLQNLIF